VFQDKINEALQAVTSTPTMFFCSDPPAVLRVGLLDLLTKALLKEIASSVGELSQAVI